MELAHVQEDDSITAEAWKQLHQPYIDAWMETEPATVITSGFDMRNCVANGLFLWSMLREASGQPGACSWVGVDPYEVLFEASLHGGSIHGDWQEELRLMGSLIRFLGQHGVIPAGELAVFEGEWDVWTTRALDVIDNECWYRRDGTRISREEMYADARRQHEAEVRRRERRSASKARRVKSKTKRAGKKFGRNKKKR